MVHRIIPAGQGFGGALRYVVQTRQGTILDSTFDPGATPNQIAAEMYDVARQNPRVEKPVGHFVLSLPPGESLSDQQWGQAARTYLHKLGYTENPFVVVRHHNTDNDHVHIILSRVRWDGRCTPTFNDRNKGLEALREIEKAFDLSAPSGRSRYDAIPGPQLHAALRKDEPNYSHELKSLLREAAVGKPDMPQFLQRLEDAGLKAHLNVAKTGHVSGIVYEYGPLTIAGRQLGRDFSWQGLQERLGIRFDPDSDREAVRRLARPQELAAPGQSSWSPPAREALRKELATLPARHRTPLRDAQASLRQAGPLDAVVQAGYLLQSLSSPTRAVRAALNRVPGAAGLNQVLTFAGAFRSPGAALSLSLSLLRRSVRSSRATTLETTILHAFERAAAADSAAAEVMDARLREVGIHRTSEGRLVLAQPSRPAPLRWMERSTSPEANVRTHLNALGGEFFDIRISGGSSPRPVIATRLRRNEILENLSLYQASNASGFRIEVRPHDRSGIHVVRNVTPEQLQAASALGFRPAVVVETSPPSSGVPSYDVCFRFASGDSRPNERLQLHMRRAYGLLFDQPPVVRTTPFAPLAGFTVHGSLATVSCADGQACSRSSRLLEQLQAHQKAEELAVIRTLARLGVPSPRAFALSQGHTAASRSTDLHWARQALAAGTPSEAVWRSLAFHGSRSRSLPVLQLQYATRALAAARSAQGLQQAAGLALSVAASALGLPTAVLKLAGLAYDVIRGLGRER